MRAWNSSFESFFALLGDGTASRTEGGDTDDDGGGRADNDDDEGDGADNDEGDLADILAEFGEGLGLGLLPAAAAERMSRPGGRVRTTPAGVGAKEEEKEEGAASCSCSFWSSSSELEGGGEFRASLASGLAAALRGGVLGSENTVRGLGWVVANEERGESFLGAREEVGGGGA
jgi:hypothetical protein